MSSTFILHPLSCADVAFTYCSRRLQLPTWRSITSAVLQQVYLKDRRVALYLAMVAWSSVSLPPIKPEFCL